MPSSTFWNQIIDKMTPQKNKNKNKTKQQQMSTIIIVWWLDLSKTSIYVYFIQFFEYVLVIFVQISPLIKTPVRKYGNDYKQKTLKVNALRNDEIKSRL